MTHSLAGLKVLFIVPPTGFREEELFIPKTILESLGATPVVASTEEGDAVGMAGGSIKALPITEPRHSNFAGVIIVGGTGSPAHLWNNGLVHKMLRMMDRDHKAIGALGESPVVLAKAGLLEKKRATVWMTSETLKLLKEGGAHYEKRPVVIDGNLLTADSPAAAERFGSLFADLLEEKKMAATPPAGQRPSGARRPAP